MLFGKLFGKGSKKSDTHKDNASDTKEEKITIKTPFTTFYYINNPPNEVGYEAEMEWDDRPESITVKMAPTSLCILQYVPFSKADLKRREEEKALLAAMDAERIAKDASRIAEEKAKQTMDWAEHMAEEAKEAMRVAKLAAKEAEVAKKVLEDASAKVAEESEKLYGNKKKR